MATPARGRAAIVPRRRARTGRRLPSPAQMVRMSSSSHASDSPITDRRQLVEYVASGEKPRSDWRIGTEHEKFGFRLDDLRPPEFDGERGIESLLRALARFGWDRVDENGRTVALLRGGASVTLEPAGQLELSGAPLEDIHQTCSEV